MNLKDLKHLKTWFADYVAGFYTDDPANNRTVRLKEKHTKRVCENIIMLGNALGLSDQEMILAETMGLFHDIGRFKQYEVYGTLNDFKLLQISWCLILILFLRSRSSLRPRGGMQNK